MMRRTGHLQVWADGYIRTGALWRRNIDEALARKRMPVVLLTPDLKVRQLAARETMLSKKNKNFAAFECVSDLVQPNMTCQNLALISGEEDLIPEIEFAR